VNRSEFDVLAAHKMPMMKVKKFGVIILAGFGYFSGIVA